MEAQVGTLAVGTRFETLLTGRQGRVCDRPHGKRDGVQVAFEVEVKVLHPEVVVRVVERVALSVEWPVVLADDDGIRPAGKPDECFYCNIKVGGQHARDCVIVHKTVLARYVIEVPVSVPHCWTKENFEFHRNESSSCANNIIRFDLAEAIGRDGCLCGFVEAEMVQVLDDTPQRKTKTEAYQERYLVRDWKPREIEA